MLRKKLLQKIDQQQNAIFSLIAENNNLVKENKRLLNLVKAYDKEHDENQKWISGLISTIKIQKAIIKNLKNNNKEKQQ